MKAVIAWLLESLDTALGHWAGCGLLNSRIYLLYDEERDDFRINLPSPTSRLYFWAIGPLDAPEV